MLHYMPPSSDDNLLTLMVWDAEGRPPAGDWIPVLWQGFASDGDSPSYHSIPRRVEEKAELLRAQYLAWIHDIGQSLVLGGRVVDKLALRPGFSYWWMTLPALISFGTRTPIYQAVRLLALEGLATELSAGKIILASKDLTLAQAIRTWCANAGLAFEWRRLGKSSGPGFSVKEIYRSLPHWVRAVVSLLRYLKSRWPLRDGGNSSGKTFDGNIAIIDYFMNLQADKLAAGRYRSNYWVRLHDALEETSVKVNWIHFFISHPMVPTAKHARGVLDLLNQAAPDRERHACLDGALNWAVVGGSIRDYARIVWTRWRFGSLRRHFRPRDSNVDLWPLLRRDWDSAMFGIVAMSNCIFLNLLERMLKALPHQRLGIYLLENQPWEMAFIHAWHAAGHGRLLGVQHTTVMYWDTRYFFDPRSYQRVGGNDLPLPDLVVLNGPAAIERFREGAFPEEKMVEAEALRYLYLADIPSRKQVQLEPQDVPIRVLILGDYFRSSTDQMMRWLIGAAHELPRNIRYTAKPHPSCAIKASDYPELEFRVADSNLAELLSDCDAAFVSNTTSAGVDAYTVGVPVIVVSDGDAFNQSPLRGLPGVTYVSGSGELARALRRVSESNVAEIQPYFCLDKAIPRWRRLLGLDEMRPA